MYPANMINPNPNTGEQATSMPMGQTMGNPDTNVSSNFQNFQHPMTAQGQNSYAKGGLTRRDMVRVDMNPREIDVLEHLQGHCERCPRTGLRSLKNFDDLLRNPHIMGNMHKHAQAYAHGGQIGATHPAEHPTHGDIESVWIGKHTNNILKHLAPHVTYNPHTGDPQYWSLGGALGGAWNAIKGAGSAAWDTTRNKIIPGMASIGSKALPYIQEAAAKGAGARFGPMGEMGVNLLGGAAQSGLESLSHMGDNPISQNTANAIGTGLGAGLQSKLAGSSAMHSMGAALNQGGDAYGGALGRGAQGMGNAMQQGQGLKQSFGSGLNKASDYYSGALGGAMQGAGQSLMQNAGLRQGAKNIGMGAFQGAGGAQGLPQMGSSLYNQYKSGASPMQMGASAMTNQYRPAAPQLSNQQAFAELPFGG